MNEKKMTTAMALGILGALILASGDWMMIYGNTAFEGVLPWLTSGVAEIPYWKNKLSMIVAFPAMVFYCFSLFKVGNFIKENEERKKYTWLTFIGITPWLCLHFFYVMILFLFSYINNDGNKELALKYCEALFNQFSWIILLSEAIMLLPFIYIFYITVRGKTVFPKISALNNPVIIFVVLKLCLKLIPNGPLTLAFLNGLMSESMIVWYFVYIILLKMKKN